MQYKALHYFEDLEDNRHPYEAGDTYPRDGVSPKPARIKKLSGKTNKRGMPLIEAIPELPQED